jgi:NAD(P)-dependent dehydrogenase (short-subunit alcohol dehydrogenase family)
MGNTAKVIPVTGASFGFGYAMVKALAAEGYRVFGTARAPPLTQRCGLGFLMQAACNRCLIKSKGPYCTCCWTQTSREA